MCRKKSVEELLADDFYGIRTPNNKNHLRLLVYYLAGIDLPSLTVFRLSFIQTRFSLTGTERNLYKADFVCMRVLLIPSSVSLILSNVL